MKEKKTKRTRKVLLMGVAAVLVAAVSVSATLAYLTAQTDSVTNTFKGSGGITGKVAEPNYTGDGTFTINQPVPKDPLIENTTADAAIYVGAKVSFWIDVTNDSTDNYVQVNPTDFYKYVDVKYNDNTAPSYNVIGTAPVNGTNTNQWYDMTGSTSDDCLYFMYNNVLNKADSDASYASSAYATGKDNTLPLFTSVTVKPAVKIDAGNATDASDIDLTAGPANQTFPVFNFKIVINGYGEKAYAVNASGNQEGDTLLTKTEAMSAIKTALEGITPLLTNPS